MINRSDRRRNGTGITMALAALGWLGAAAAVQTLAQAQSQTQTQPQAQPQPGAASASSAPAVSLERAFERNATVPAWVQRTTAIPADSANETLGIRLADVQFRVDAVPAYYQHKAIVAHEASALGALGQIDIAFQPAYQHVQLHRLAVLRGGVAIDKLQQADIRFLQRERGLEQGVYDGSVTAQIVTTDVRVGDTLDIEYSVSGQNPVFGKHVVLAAQWDYPMPVAQRTIVLDTPADKIVSYRMIGAPAPDAPQPRQNAAYRDGRKVLTLGASAMPAVLGEAYVPFDAQQYRWLQFSDFASWADVNAWAMDLFSATTAPAVLDGPLRSARAAATQEEAIVKVLAFVQNEIRYLSVSMGENSHRPFAPAQVLERRYGDCKDKTLLAVTMLRALGIDAQPVLVATDATTGLDRMLPSPLLFDHAIVHLTVHGKEYFLDPTRTGQVSPLEQWGQVHGGRQVLVIDAQTTALTTIPQPPAAQLRGRRSERIDVTAMDQPVQLTERLEATGAAAEGMRAQLERMSKRELHKAYEGALVKRYPDAQLVGEPVIADDRAHNTVAIDAHYQIARLFTPSAAGDNWTMQYVPSNLTELFAPPGNAHRRYPLAVPLYPDVREYDLTLNLPPSFAMQAGSVPRTIDDAAFRVVRVLDVSKRALHLNMTLTAREDRVMPARLPEYLKNMQQFTEMLGGSLRVYKSDMIGAGGVPNGANSAGSPAGSAGATAAAASGKPATPSAGAPATSAAPARPTAQARLEQRIVGATRIIADADITGRDSAAALCERALAHAWLGHKADAQKDIARAVQLQPTSGDALRCRADVYFIVGRFRDSEADYAKLIARGADQADFFQARGLANVYLNKPSLAQADLRSAVTKADNDADRLRAALWYRIAGGTDALPALPAPDAELAWLLDAAAMFAGSVEPERMLSHAARNLAAGSDDRLVEAYFYAGRYYLGKGETIKARAYFQRAVDKHVYDSAYHVAAQHELTPPSR